MGRPRISLAAKLDQHVDRSGGPDACHPWTGHRNRYGYGSLAYIDPDTGKRRAIMASRAALMVALGRPIPPDLFVLHACDNPPCCNPRHLREGTQADNMRDRIEHGAGYAPRFSKIPPHVIEAVRREYRPGVHGHGQHALAGRYGLSRSQVQRIVTAQD